MGDTTLRYIELLKLLPRHPKKADSRTLTESLENHGFTTTQRTVQRDLVKLSERFPIASDDRDATYGWSWMQGAKGLELPSMDPATALAFHLVEQYIPELLPPSVRNALDMHFERARHVLNDVSDEPVAAWPKRVAVIHQTLPHHTPETNPEVGDTIYRCLLERKQFRATYRSRTHDESRTYRITPLGLVVYRQLIYLVATINDYTDPVQLALHRFETAEALDQTAKEPEGFSLEKYIQEGAFEYGAGEEITLKLRVTPEIAYHLSECPLSRDQALEPNPDSDDYIVEAKVLESAQLQWWLRGFGPLVEILGPEKLRKEFTTEAETLAKIYR